MNKGRAHYYAGQNCFQVIHQCVIQRKSREGIQFLAIQLLQSFGVERGTLHQGNSEVKTSLHQVLELPSSKGPLASL